MSVLPELEALELYRQIFQDNRAIKLLIDPASGEIVDANQAAAQFYGYSIDVLRTMNIRAINTAAETTLSSALESARTSDRTHFRFSHRIASGEVRKVEVFSGPLTVGGRALLFSIVQDITDRERFEQQLRDVQRMEAVGRLAGGVAHDFNNLLLVILNATKLMSRKLEETSPLQPYLQHVDIAASRAADLTRELLLFARGVEPVAEPIDLRDVLRSIEPLLRTSIGDTVALRMEFPDETCPVLVPRAQLEQVLVNLAVNARDAMPNGGDLRFVLHRKARVVDLAVADTGTGMSPATASHIFEPFFTTKERGRGTGLGLAITYGIVQRAGGRIAVASELGVGTTFTITLPLEELDDAPAQVLPVAPPFGKGETILVVDDDDLVRSSIVGTLREARYVVIGVGSAADAIKWADAHAHLDLLLTDVVMPHTTGPDLAAKLCETRPELRVLFMSGYTGNIAGLADAEVIAKPFDEQVLWKRVAALLHPI